MVLVSCSGSRNLQVALATQAKACGYLQRMQQLKLLSIYKRLYREFGPQGWWPVVGRGTGDQGLGTRNDERFEIIVGAILTQNTAWKNVETVMGNLVAARAMSPRAIVRMPSRNLQRLIRPAGYFRQKTKKLKIFSRWYLKRNGSLRHMQTAALRKELLGIWGIGPETADSILLYAFSRPVFVVDAYTRRFVVGRGFNPAMAGINSRPTYDHIQKYFMSQLPRSVKLYNEFHALIVAWGKQRNSSPFWRGGEEG